MPGGVSPPWRAVWPKVHTAMLADGPDAFLPVIREFRSWFGGLTN
jgi:hypothetical protein